MADYLNRELNCDYYKYISDPDYISLVEQDVERACQLYGIVHGQNVAIVTTKVPFNWIKSFSDRGCNVTVIGYHPLLLQTQEIIKLLFPKTQISKRNIFLDSFDDIDNYDLVVYPDFESFIPLDKVKYNLSNKNFIVSNCFMADDLAIEMGYLQPTLMYQLKDFKSTLGQYIDNVDMVDQIWYRERKYFHFFSKPQAQSMGERVVKFITFKWGNKYGPKYINRLYDGIKRTYSGKFHFYCVTDNSSGIIPEVKILSFQDIGFIESDCFTIQKMFAFKKGTFKFPGPYAVLDIDIIIHGDLKPYFDEYNFTEGRFIKNYWESIEGCRNLSHFGACWLNSSFVTWDGDQLDFIYEFYKKHQKKIEWKYGDLDYFLWSTLVDKLNYHPPKIVYTYSFGAHYPDQMEKEVYRDDYKIILFNTSHGTGVELHDARGWPEDLWTAGTRPS